jgi:flagellar hook-basal body complex protein FliE
MFPISSIPPVVSSYGLDPQGQIASTDLPSKLQAPLPLTGPTETTTVQPAGDSFANMLGRMVEEVNARQGVTSDAVAALQSGQNVSLHQAVIAMEEANLSFQLMVEVRNKLLDSYQELMRMQV